MVAHPDDESMFFGPTFIHVLREVGRHNVYLLCLTNGNYYGLGKLREMELFQSCLLFGLRKENVEIVNNLQFQDGHAKWDKRLVIKEIMKSVEKHNINSIITFDSGGISNHPNHKAIHDAIWEDKNDKDLNRKIFKCYFLESVNIFRKYVSIFDLCYSILDCYFSLFFKKERKFIVVGSWSDRNIVLNAMKKHKSQYVWFRKLYVVFSRYILLNTLEYRAKI